MKVKAVPTASERSLQHAQIDDRVRRRQLAPDEAGEGEHRGHRQDGDVAGGEPVLGLAAFEHDLQRADAEDQQADPRPVDAR